MRRFRVLGLVLIVILLMPALVSAQGEAVTIDLNELNDSGISGTATLTPVGDQTEVVVTLEAGMGGALDTARPNHIHSGQCGDDLGGVEYPLTDVTDTATTTIEASLESLMDGNHAVNVHMSSDEIGTYIACGNIPSAMMMPETGGVSSAWLTVAAAGLMLLLAGFATRRALA